MTLPAETSRFLRHSQPSEIVRWALTKARRPILSTNFRPLSIALIHLVNRMRPGIPVVWIDTGYNTEATYEFVDRVSRQLALNLQVYTPLMTARRREALYGGVPALDSHSHQQFSDEVKLEPFRRALRELTPDVWFTGIRREQNEFRAGLGVISDGPNDSRRVAPFFYWGETALHDYIRAHGLPDNHDYYDPTKGPEHRECGLQLLA